MTNKEKYAGDSVGFDLAFQRLCGKYPSCTGCTLRCGYDGDMECVELWEEREADAEATPGPAIRNRLLFDVTVDGKPATVLLSADTVAKIIKAFKEEV
jgi:hypothetical protein